MRDLWVKYLTTLGLCAIGAFGMDGSGWAFVIAAIVILS